VVMPEHVHLLVSEPERGKLSVALQMLKQVVARKLRTEPTAAPFWQPRYLRFRRLEPAQVSGEAVVHSHQSGAPRVGGESARLAVEQLSTLAYGSRGDGGDRMRNGRRASGSESGLCRRSSGVTIDLPTLRQKRAKGWGTRQSAGRGRDSYTWNY
jgi:hypothetical protein